MSIEALTVILIAIALGSYAKGAIGIGLPIVAIPTNTVNMLKGYQELLLIADARLFAVACQAEDFDVFADDEIMLVC